MYFIATVAKITVHTQYSNQPGISIVVDRGTLYHVYYIYRLFI